MGHPLPRAANRGHTRLTVDVAAGRGGCITVSSAGKKPGWPYRPCASVLVYGSFRCAERTGCTELVRSPDYAALVARATSSPEMSQCEAA
jgi:hypothetical protein